MAASRNKRSTDDIPQATSACLTRHVGQNQSVVVGLSGGLDSTVLLHAASRLAGDLGFRLFSLHVNHGLSPNADSWASSCARLCEDLGVPFEVARVDVPRDTREGLESAARRLRHQALLEHQADWILLAHHADDQAETVLHNLLRGAGVRGAAAMPASRGRILRPLLGLGRSVLQEYAKAHGLMWSEDESNADCRYTRNFLRHEVLPVVTSRFPNAGEQLAAAAARFGEADALLDELAALDLRDHRPEFPLPLKLFRDVSAIRARNLLRSLLNAHAVQSPDERRLGEFVRQVMTTGNDRHPRLDLAGYALWCADGKLHFRRTT